MSRFARRDRSIRPNPGKPEKGSNLMCLRPLTSIAPAVALSLLVVVGVPGTASALGHRHHAGQGCDARVGYAVPIQSVYQYPGVIVGPPTLPYGYAVPIQTV